MTHHIDIDTLVLYSGSHTGGPPPGTPGCKMCLFEAYNAIQSPPDAPQQITDERPPDMSPVLHRMGMRLNDALPDDKRQKLKRFLPRGGVSPLAGTRDDGLDELRGWLATDWVLRTATPLWLDAVVAAAAADKWATYHKTYTATDATAQAHIQQQRYGPTIAAVQDSAIDLYTRLVNPAKETADAH